MKSANEARKATKEVNPRYAAQLTQYYLTHPVELIRWRGKIAQEALKYPKEHQLIGRVAEMLHDLAFAEVNGSSLTQPIAFILRTALGEVDWTLIAMSLVEQLGPKKEAAHA